MLWETLSAARDIGRLHDIATILMRYGFADVVRRLGIVGVLERSGKTLKLDQTVELARLEPAERFRHVLEDLGPTFIKLGQILATRVDLFSPDWITEFERLQDHAPAVPFEQIHRQLQEDLGCDPAEVFAELDPVPLAAASIAQVHLARLHDGSAVVVKVRRPGIRPLVEADLRLLARIAEIAEAEIPDLRRFRPSEVVRQFTLSFRRELDLAAECRNAERIARHFANQPDIVIPKVYWPWCGERMNVQSLIERIPGRQLDAVDKAGLDRKRLAQLGAQAMLTMMLEHGLFHADPHQGNVFYLSGNRVAFIDFGMVGRLTAQRRTQVVNLLYGLVTQRSEQVIEVLLDWAGDVEVDSQRLALEVEGFVDQYHGVALKDLNLAAMLTEMTALLRDNGLSLPADLALLVKAFISLEGMGRQLAPEFDMVAEASPFLERAMLQRYAPDALAKRGWSAMTHAFELFTGLPQDLRQLLRAARSGQFKLHVDVTRLKTFGNQLDRAASRMAVGNVTAALIIGSSIVMTVEGGPTLLGLPLFGLLGFIAALIGGLWLLLSVWRSGHRD